MSPFVAALFAIFCGSISAFAVTGVPLSGRSDSGDPYLVVADDNGIDIQNSPASDNGTLFPDVPVGGATAHSFVLRNNRPDSVTVTGVSRGTTGDFDFFGGLGGSNAVILLPGSDIERTALQ